jgi:hypothetical protein
MRRTLALATSLPLILAACATSNAITAEDLTRQEIMAEAPPAPEQATRQASLIYPPTAREAVVEEQFGVKVADPYRWLENDVRNDNRVRDWVTAQNQVTNSFLETLPHRAAFKERMRRSIISSAIRCPTRQAIAISTPAMTGCRTSRCCTCARG